MKTLIVEDDLISRKALKKLLMAYGDCDIAVDGAEAIAQFKLAWEEQAAYDLICLDIQIPKISGQEVLRKIREWEKKNGISGLDGVKIFMTTVQDDPQNILKAFRYQCESYLRKPITKEALLNELQANALI